MPPGQKERNETKRSKHDSKRTLDQFFSKKTDSKSPITTKNQSTSNNPRSLIDQARQNNHLTSAIPEVIIIDSDDELDVPVTRTGAKKRKHSEDPDIEIVDVNAVSVNCTVVAEVATEGGTTLASGTCSNSNLTFSFGKPSLLPDATSGSQQGAFQFGTVGNLLGSPNQGVYSPSTPLVTSSSSMIRATNVDSHPVNVKECLSESAQEDWLMGDDEMGDTTLKDEEETEEVEFVEGILMDCDEFVEICPYCERKLHKLQTGEAQAHLRSCLGATKEDNLKGPTIKTSDTNEFDVKVSTGTNAFSILMTSFKENEVWKEATAAEDKTFRPVKANGGRRKAPFYKVLQGMPISVDAFRYGTIPGVNAYFLSHAHSDHYTNLSSSWKSGPIYCSQGTANLIIHMLSVDKKWVRPLPMNTPTVIPDTDEVQVTLIEANHCPGSCLFLFEGKQTVNAGDSAFRSPFVGSSRIFRYLHCGDFRASPRHVTHPAIRGKKIDHVYLDTTYLDPKYTFPPQPLVISACAELSRRLVNGEPTTTNKTMKSWLSSLSSMESSACKERTLVVVGTYSIGKERIVKAIAHALGSQVYCDARKTAILRCEGDEELEAMLTTNPLAATVHLVPLGTIATDRLKIYMDRFKGTFGKVVGFRPTGWTYSQPAGTDLMPSVASVLTRISQKDFTYTDLHQSPKSSSTIQVYGVPYSEHSSFFELTCFAMSFNWTKMIATVNVGNENSRGKMSKWVERWEAERKKRGPDVLVTPRHDDYW